MKIKASIYAIPVWVILTEQGMQMRPRPLIFTPVLWFVVEWHLLVTDILDFFGVEREEGFPIKIRKSDFEKIKDELEDDE